MVAGAVAQARTIVAAAFACAVALPVPAHADTGDVVLAEALFRDGRELLAHGDYGHACPKLAESFRLDPATGTLLALALCHEREGKFASAWGEYSEAASRSRSEGRADREGAARTKIKELEPNLSMLTIRLSNDEPQDLEIYRNGVLVEPAWLGTAVPVDGGIVTIEAFEPGDRHWQTQVVVAATGDHQTVTIPPVEKAGSVEKATPAAPERPARPIVVQPALAPEPPAPEPTRVPEPRRVHRQGPSGLQWGGIVTGIVGLGGLAAGGVFTSFALKKNHDSKAFCSPADPDLCSAQGRVLRRDARTDGNIATVGLVAGGVLAATGLTMILAGGHRRGAGEAPTSVRVEAAPTFDAQGFGGTIMGRF